jgi:hypothetical protein
VFALGAGHDRINDFADGLDLIRLVGLAADFSTVTVAAQGASDTLVTVGAVAILLTGVAPAQITSGDFVFA